MFVALWTTQTQTGSGRNRHGEIYDFKKVAANHCSGIPAVKKMIELGYPVVKGTGRFGSKGDLVVGNGDEVFFG